MDQEEILDFNTVRVFISADKASIAPFLNGAVNSFMLPVGRAKVDEALSFQVNSMLTMMLDCFQGANAAMNDFFYNYGRYLNFPIGSEEVHEIHRRVASEAQAREKEFNLEGASFADRMTVINLNSTEAYRQEIQSTWNNYGSKDLISSGIFNAAKSFVFELYGVTVASEKLKEFLPENGPVEDAVGHFQGIAPNLRALRNSIAHRDDRLLGRGRPVRGVPGSYHEVGESDLDHHVNAKGTRIVQDISIKELSVFASTTAGEVGLMVHPNTLQAFQKVIGDLYWALCDPSGLHQIKPAI